MSHNRAASPLQATPQYAKAMARVLFNAGEDDRLVEVLFARSYPFIRTQMETGFFVDERLIQAAKQQQIRRHHIWPSGGVGLEKRVDFAYPQPSGLRVLMDMNEVKRLVGGKSTTIGLTSVMGHHDGAVRAGAAASGLRRQYINTARHSGA